MPEPGGAMIRVTRDKRRSPDRHRSYTLFVDDDEAGVVDRGQTAELPVRPGRHWLRASVEFEHSRIWSMDLSAGDVVHLVCRSRRKKPSDGYLDLFLADPSDRRAHLGPPSEDQLRDMTNNRRAVTRGGQVLSVWAHRSGYLRSLEPRIDSTSGDDFLAAVAFFIVVLPVLAGLRWVRHRLVFKRGWSVGVVRDRRFLWPKKVLLERYPDEARARARAAEILLEIESTAPRWVALRREEPGFWRAIRTRHAGRRG